MFPRRRQFFRYGINPASRLVNISVVMLALSGCAPWQVEENDFGGSTILSRINFSANVKNLFNISITEYEKFGYTKGASAMSGAIDDYLHGLGSRESLSQAAVDVLMHDGFERGDKSYTRTFSLKYENGIAFIPFNINSAFLSESKSFKKWEVSIQIHAKDSKFTKVTYID